MAMETERSLWFVPVYLTILPMSRFPLLQRTYPTTFFPPNNDETPETLFRDGVFTDQGHMRWVHRDNPSAILYCVSGCYSPENNQYGASAFVYGPQIIGYPGSGMFCLDTRIRGPMEQLAPQTEERAHLQAAVSALTFARSVEPTPRIRTLVIATHRDHLAHGAAIYTPQWVADHWRGENGERVANCDIWLELLAEVEGLAQRGIDVQFWRLSSIGGRMGSARLAAEAAARVRWPHGGGFLTQPNGVSDGVYSSSSSSAPDAAPDAGPDSAAGDAAPDAAGDAAGPDAACFDAAAGAAGPDAAGTSAAANAAPVGAPVAARVAAPVVVPVTAPVTAPVAVPVTAPDVASADATPNNAANATVNAAADTGVGTTVNFTADSFVYTALDTAVDAALDTSMDSASDTAINAGSNAAPFVRHSI